MVRFGRFNPWTYTGLPWHKKGMDGTPSPGSHCIEIKFFKIILHVHPTDSPRLDILCSSWRHLTSHNVSRSASWIRNPEFHYFLRRKTTMVLSPLSSVRSGIDFLHVSKTQYFSSFLCEISISWLTIHSMFRIKASSISQASNKSARALSWQRWKLKLICFPFIYLFSIPYARNVKSNLDWTKERCRFPPLPAFLYPEINGVSRKWKTRSLCLDQKTERPWQRPGRPFERVYEMDTIPEIISILIWKIGQFLCLFACLFFRWHVFCNYLRIHVTQTGSTVPGRFVCRKTSF